MKNFFENFNVETIKEFCTRHFHQIMFVILTAIVTTMAILFNYMTNNGYGSFLNLNGGEPSHRYYHENDSYNCNRSNRQPWTMQKPSSNRSSKSSSSSGRH